MALPKKRKATTVPTSALKSIGNGKQMPVRSRPAENPPVDPPMLQPEQVLEARYVSPARMFLRFADGLKGTWTFEELGLDMSNMKPTTIKASAGTSVEVTSKWGEDVQLDSSSLRVLVDPAYAAEIDKKLNLLADRIGL